MTKIIPDYFLEVVSGLYVTWCNIFFRNAPGGVCVSWAPSALGRGSTQRDLKALSGMKNMTSSPQHSATTTSTLKSDPCPLAMSLFAQTIKSSGRLLGYYWFCDACSSRFDAGVTLYTFQTAFQVAWHRSRKRGTSEPWFIFKSDLIRGILQTSFGFSVFVAYLQNKAFDTGKQMNTHNASASTSVAF